MSSNSGSTTDSTIIPPEIPCEYSQLQTLIDSIRLYELPKYDHLIRSNYVPSNEERTVIENKIAFMDSSISTLKDLLRGIKMSRKHHRALLSPLRKIPNEILSQIFSYLVDEIVISEENSPVYDLMKVCRRWSNIIESNSMFWNKFNLDTKRNMSSDLISYRLKRCLDLSRARPLSITFRQTSDLTQIERKYIRMCLEKHDFVEEFLLELMGGIWYFDLSMYPSWKILKRLSITLCRRHVVSWDLLAALSSMPFIEELSLKHIEYYAGYITPIENLKIVHLESLKSLHLENVCNAVYEYGIKMFRVPGLSKLRIDNTSEHNNVVNTIKIIKDVVEKSECSPGLETLELAVNVPPQIILSLLETLSNIKSLSLAGRSISVYLLNGIPDVLMDLEILELDFLTYSEPIDKVMDSLRSLMECYYGTHPSKSLLEIKCILSKTERLRYAQPLKDLEESYWVDKRGSKP